MSLRATRGSSCGGVWAVVTAMTVRAVRLTSTCTSATLICPCRVSPRSFLFRYLSSPKHLDQYELTFDKKGLRSFQWPRLGADLSDGLDTYRPKASRLPGFLFAARLLAAGGGGGVCERAAAAGGGGRLHRARKSRPPCSRCSMRCTHATSQRTTQVAASATSMPVRAL